MRSVQNYIEKNPVFLAPMAGINDAPFRSICKEMGAGLTYTEMISAASVVFQGFDQTYMQELLAFAPNEVPLAVQIFGSSPHLMAEAASRIEQRFGDDLALIDINMGCPVSKVVNKGEGAALMKDHARAAAIVKNVVHATELPITVKIRSGWDKASINAVEFAGLLEEQGASAVCVHPRTSGQLYKGMSDWSIIKEVKHALDIPVFGSGDLFSREDIKEMFAQTDVDAVLIARGAQGNPWIFSETEPTFEDRIDMAKRHAFALRDFIGEERATRRMRKHVMWYTSGLPAATVLRGRVNTAISFDSLIELLDEYKARLRNNQEHE